MNDFLEVRGPSGTAIVPLAGEPGARVSVGRGPGNTVELAGDPRVSGQHAVLEWTGGGWCVSDLGSRNGTLLGGERIHGLRAMRNGDELLLGRTRVTLRSRAADQPATEGAEPPPMLTPRERDVLVALCRPFFAGRTFAQPASARQVAAELVVTEDAVQQHLLRLYRKFGLAEGPDRRVRLAAEALERGAVTVADV
ncbi:FHA domain-containing protein [Pseudonocardia pini]|uniref:FHA domain-containing protein n=1 Tax=Pseudonocardia pini TaxID=2758030 RepID=UPI0015F0FB7D|nr:FHA domain-containing protein [Pseudonocardia pini]